ncbi:MAG: hypothetical protein RLZZ458_2686 [Planctomycetota bacterium]
MELTDRAHQLPADRLAEIQIVFLQERQVVRAVSSVGD